MWQANRKRLRNSSQTGIRIRRPPQGDEGKRSVDATTRLLLWCQPPSDISILGRGTRWSRFNVLSTSDLRSPYHTRYCVDSPIFLVAESSTDAFSAAKSDGSINPQKKDRQMCFPNQQTTAKCFQGRLAG